MRVAKDQVDVRLEIPGAVIRQRTDFGDVADSARSAASTSRSRRASTRRRSSRGWRATSASARTGASSCAAGSPRPTRTASHETVNANDLFYWPPGHNVRVEADAEIVMFSPQHEHSHVIDHMIEKVRG